MSPKDSNPSWRRIATAAPYAITIIGVIILIAAGVGWALLPGLIRDRINEEVAIASPSSRLYSGWINPQSDGIEVFRKFTFYNLTNPFEVATNGTVPNFVPRGPFVYREVRQKDPKSVRWHSNGTVSYRYSSTYFFEPTMSIDEFSGERLSDAEVLTILNAPLFGLVHRMQRLPADISFFPKWAACDLLQILVNNTVLGDKGIMIKRSVHEILWGFIDPIWHSVHGALGLVNYHAAEWFRSEWNGSYVVPSPYTYRSGQMCPLWDNINECNTSANGETIEVSGANWRDSGSSSPENGLLSKWADQEELWWWGPQKEGWDGGEDVMGPLPTHNPNESFVGAAAPTRPRSTALLKCQTVHGFDGSRFPPNNAILSRPKLTLFLDMFWRNVDFVHNGSSRVRGIDTQRYILDPVELDPQSGDTAVCYQAERYGVLNFSRPLFGPALGTKAMYLDSDLNATDLNFTVSLSWDGARTPVTDFLDRTYGPRGSPAYRERFDSFLDVHPLTGLTLNVSAQGTASTYFGPLGIAGCGMFAVTESFPVVPYYPLVTVTRHTHVTSTKAAELRHYLMLLDVIYGCDIAGFALGGLMLTIGLVWLWRRWIYARAADAQAMQQDDESQDATNDSAANDKCGITAATSSSRSSGSGGSAGLDSARITRVAARMMAGGAEKHEVVPILSPGGNALNE